MTSADGTKDAIGAQSFAIGTVEVTFPVGLPEEFGLSGAVFSDFGTVFQAPEKSVGEGKGLCTPDGDANVDTCRVFDTAAFRASVGAGIIWESPFGPLRVDVAYPLMKASYDNTEWFRFSIGTRF
jgi:outer membrane protein insertion porin family